MRRQVLAHRRARLFVRRQVLARRRRRRRVAAAALLLCLGDRRGAEREEEARRGHGRGEEKVVAGEGALRRRTMTARCEELRARGVSERRNSRKYTRWAYFYEFTKLEYKTLWREHFFHLPNQLATC